MDSLNNILSFKNFDEPPEATSLKKYVDDTFHAKIAVVVHTHEIIITVPNAALASTLRLRAPEMKRRCQIIDKRLIFRIA